MSHDSIVQALIGTTVVAAMVTLVAMLLRRTPAVLRHLIWRITVAAFVVVPIVVGAVGALGVHRVNVSIPLPSAPTMLQLPPLPNLVPPSAVSPAPPAPRSPDTNATAASQPHLAPPLILLLWLGGCVASGLLLLRQLLSLSRLYSSRSMFEDPHFASRLEAWFRQVGLSKSPALASSSLVQVPTVIGWRRPIILLPRELPVEQERLDGCLLHELAHVSRHDLAWLTLARLLQVVWWWHPLLWLASRELRETAEQACDDWAVALSGERRQYAEVLVSYAAAAAGSGVALGSRGRALTARVRRILSRDEQPVLHLPAWSRTMVLMLGVILVIAVSGTRVTGTRFFAPDRQTPAVATVTQPASAPAPGANPPAPAATSPTAPTPEALPPADVAPQQPPSETAPVPQPISLCLAKPLGCGMPPRLKQALENDRKHTYPVTLTWPLIAGASRYVAELTPLWSRTPLVRLESNSYWTSADERALPPGGYEWTVAVYDSQGRLLGNIEPSNPLRVFATADPRPRRGNGKTALLDLRPAQGTIEAWGAVQHEQYMMVELLQQAGFAVEVNANQPLTPATLAHMDLLICSYQWVRSRFNPFSPDEITTIGGFVRGGGSLLVTTGGGSMAPYADPLLQEFGCRVDRNIALTRQEQAEPARGQRLVRLEGGLPLIWPTVVTGGREMATIMECQGQPVVEAGRFGHGRIIVAGIGMTLADCHLRAIDPGDPVYVRLFYGFVKYLTDVDCEGASNRQFVLGLLGT